MRNKFLILLCMIFTAAMASAKTYNIFVQSTSSAMPALQILDFSGEGMWVTNNVCYGQRCYLMLKATSFPIPSGTLTIGTSLQNQCIINFSADMFGLSVYDTSCTPAFLQVSGTIVKGGAALTISSQVKR